MSAHLISLVTGDLYRDGHGWTERITICSPLSEAEIEEAYRRGSEILGFDLVRDVAEEYEDSYISGDYVQRLIGAGCDMFADDGAAPEASFLRPDIESWEAGPYDENDPLDDRWWMNPEAFTRLYLFIVTLGSPGVQFELLTPAIMRIGGYGLFGG